MEANEKIRRRAREAHIKILMEEEQWEESNKDCPMRAA